MEGGKRVYTEKDFQRIRFIKRLKHLGLTLSEMHELENVYKIHRTNRKVLSRLLELLDNHVQKIDERINNLVRLKDDIISYRENIRQKISADGNSQKERT
jgi:DNA-binding transcriptional MerR regulator